MRAASLRRRRRAATLDAIVFSVAIVSATVAFTLVGASREARAASPVVTVRGGAGFDDSTPVTPVGGNPGTTLGAQRLFVFQKAAEAWGSKLDSSVPIVIDADFDSLGCSAGGAVLGHAGPTYAVPLDVAGLPAKTLFPLPLARHIVGKADISNLVRNVDATVPDIGATFNSDLGKSGCGVEAFYYGIDGNTGGKPDLYGTVLHELAHGLGFSSAVQATGTVSGGAQLDIFSRHVFDDVLNASWANLTATQRQTSYLDVRNVVWDGENVKRQAREILSPGAPSLTFSPAVSGFSGILSEAEFGNWDTSGTWSGAIGVPADCTRAAAGSPLAGKIAFLASQACPVVQAAATAQAAGAIAAIGVDFNDENPPDTARAPPSLSKQLGVRVPVFMVSYDDATRIAAAVKAGTVNATLTRDPNHLVGADSQGRTYLFATNPDEPGSSISHWDVLARPDLVQEPTEPSVAPTDLSMELALFRDIGWNTLCGNEQLDTGESCDEGARNGDGTSGCSARCKLPGSPGTGGVTGSGGMGTGGNIATGGVTGTGGTGGASGTGGGSDTGGTFATGGMPGTATGGIPGKPLAQAVIGGCGCRLSDPSENVGGVFLAVGSLLFASRRRRRVR